MTVGLAAVGTEKPELPISKPTGEIVMENYLAAVDALLNVSKQPSKFTDAEKQYKKAHTQLTLQKLESASQKLAEQKITKQKAENELKQTREIVEGFNFFNQEAPEFARDDLRYATTNFREASRSLTAAQQAYNKAQREHKNACENAINKKQSE